jgi:hypothetical protein
LLLAQILHLIGTSIHQEINIIPIQYYVVQHAIQMTMHLGRKKESKLDLLNSWNILFKDIKIILHYNFDTTIICCTKLPK